MALNQLLQKEYKKHYKRVKKYIKRFEEIGWEIPETLYPKDIQSVTKRDVKKFSKIYIKEFRSKLKKIVNQETGEILTGKKAKEYGAQREKEWREYQKQKKEDAEIPYFGFVMELKSRLNSLPSGKWTKASSGGKMFYSFTERANVLISIVDDNLMHTNYIYHLNNNKERIINEIDKWEMYDSGQEDLEYSFIGLFNLLDYNHLYDISDVAEELSLMTDYHNSN